MVCFSEDRIVGGLSSHVSDRSFLVLRYAKFVPISFENFESGLTEAYSTSRVL